MQIFIYCKVTLHVSGVHRTHHQEYTKTVTAASGTGHNIGTAISLQRGRFWTWPCWTEVACSASRVVVHSQYIIRTDTKWNKITIFLLMKFQFRNFQKSLPPDSSL